MTTNAHLTVRHAELVQAETFFTERGAFGREGTGLLAFTADHDDDRSWSSTRFLAPDQIGGRVDAGGCWVEITPTGQQQIAVALKPGERFLARIHSHPAAAFHSPTDDRNPVLTHEGAISIVVPFFGLGLRRGLDACAVLRRSGSTWVDLPVGPDRERWVTDRA